MKSRAKSLGADNPVRQQRDGAYYTWRLQQLDQAIERARLTKDQKEDVHLEYVLDSVEIVCTTFNCCSNLMEFLPTADICIIDEATQQIEPNTLLPLRLGVRAMVLVGDSHQKPSIAQSRRAGELGLDRSLFERIRSACVPHTDAYPLFRLNRQYRMQLAICAWPNHAFYGNRMETDPSTTEAGAECLLLPYTVFSVQRRQSATDSIVRMLKILGPYVQNFSIGIIVPYAQLRNELMTQLK